MQGSRDELGPGHATLPRRTSGRQDEAVALCGAEAALTGEFHERHAEVFRHKNTIFLELDVIFIDLFR